MTNYYFELCCNQLLLLCSVRAAFMEKNNDALHDSLGQLMVHSTDPFVKELFPASGAKKETNSKKLALTSVGSKFKVSTIVCVYVVCVCVCVQCMYVFMHEHLCLCVRVCGVYICVCMHVRLCVHLCLMIVIILACIFYVCLVQRIQHKYLPMYN